MINNIEILLILAFPLQQKKSHYKYSLQMHAYLRFFFIYFKNLALNEYKVRKVNINFGNRRFSNWTILSFEMHAFKQEERK